VCKTSANSGILLAILFSTFQEICSGCCTVAAQTLRLACAQSPEDRYSTNRLEATYISFVLRVFYELLRLEGDRALPPAGGKATGGDSLLYQNTPGIARSMVRVRRVWARAQTLSGLRPFPCSCGP
jgi:hypothetical protein